MNQLLASYIKFDSDFIPIRSGRIGVDLSKLLDHLTKITVIGFAFIFPLFFLNLTTEYYETPKFLLLLITMAVLLVVFFLRWLIEGKFTVFKTPLDKLILLLAVTLSVSCVFAPNKPLSIIGNIPKIHPGLASYLVFILMYWVVVSTLRHFSSAKQLIIALISSGTVLSAISLLSYFGINILALAFTSSLAFTPTGSSFSTNSLLVVTLPFLLIMVTGESKINLPLKLALTLVLIFYGAAIALTGSIPIYIGTLAALLLVVYFTPRKVVVKNMIFLLIPAILTITLIIFSLFPIAKPINKLYSRHQIFPAELQLPFVTSWKISVSSFRDAPFWGSGLGTYQYNFTTYKPIEFNKNTYWNIRFDRGFNEYLEILATSGVVSLISLIIITIAFLSLGLRVAFTTTQETNHNLWRKASAFSVVLFFLFLLIHPSTLTQWVAGVLVLASFIIFNKSSLETASAVKEKTEPVSKNTDIVPLLSFLIFFILVGAAIFFAGKYSLADYHYRQAINAAANNKRATAYDEMTKAKNLNPHSDLYRIGYAQTNFAIANAIAANKGPTESSPGGSLTEQDKKTIQTLLVQSINEGKAASELNPRNAFNYEVLGSIYRQLAGVSQNALVFSLDSYGRAIQQDPLNPLLRLTVGGIYNSMKNYDLAVRFYTDAINLKPDFANAYYNLSLSLRERGDIKNALLAAEKAVTLIDPSSNDYEVAAKLLSELKETPPNTQQATEEAVVPEKTELPKVVDLPKPDKISTPEAVESGPTGN